MLTNTSTRRCVYGLATLLRGYSGGRQPVAALAAGVGRQARHIDRHHQALHRAHPRPTHALRSREARGGGGHGKGCLFTTSNRTAPYAPY